MVEVCRLQRLLEVAEDPDSEILTAYAKGVVLGAEERLPRTPAVFTRKRKWRLEDTSEWSQRYCDNLRPGRRWSGGRCRMTTRLGESSSCRPRRSSGGTATGWLWEPWAW